MHETKKVSKDRKGYSAGLYMRISREDAGTRESASIGTQRKMLQAFAADSGFCVYEEYIDDGWSGTSFDRPAFRRMLEDIEGGRVNMVITKDLSRLGRDYITAGQYMEIYFPSKGVRYIALNDGYDSEGPFNDIVPFKNVINEMYARDASRKICSAFLTKMREGKFIGNFAPYGFEKDVLDKGHLVIDDEAAEVVRRIFDMAGKGAGPSAIARILNGEGVVSPGAYRCRKYPHLKWEKYAGQGVWSGSTVSKILRNVVYAGDMAQRKNSKVSFKSKAVVRNAQAEWIVVRGTHEGIVSRKRFAAARRWAHAHG